MLLTIRTTRPPATDLGYLLHKHPERVQDFSLKFGRAQVFYPEAGEHGCTAALLLEIDPVGLVRGRKGARGGDSTGPLEQYVNDRPYVASSFLSVAIAQVFGSALAGKCGHRAELAEEALPLEARLPAVPARGGVGFVRRLFEPLGYEVETAGRGLDEAFPEWGQSPYVTLTLRRTGTVRELLAHLYVLIPVLDAEKHYFIGEAEVEKLLRHGEGWLAAHPEREEIAMRYLRRRRSLARLALERLREEDTPSEATAPTDAGEESLEKPLRLNEVRMATVRDRLRELGARSVVDLGCGEGKLLRLLLRVGQFSRVVGMDTSIRALETAARRLRLDDMAPRMRERIELLHGSLTYRDARFESFDAAALVEVVEHVDPSRLASLERVVFEHARPGTVIVTTPNVEYNVRFESLVGGRFRHRDHRFEWTREEFAAWAASIEERFGYVATLEGIGDEDPELGPPCQMAVFRR